MASSLSDMVSEDIFERMLDPEQWEKDVQKANAIIERNNFQMHIAEMKRWQFYKLQSLAKQLTDIKNQYSITITKIKSP